MNIIAGATVDRKILVVDDEVSIRTMLTKAFTQAGYQPIVAADAEEALSILGRESIQVMFIDLKLPGMNGIELSRRNRKDNPLACVYAMTGYSSLFELADCRDAGFDDYFLKPIDLSILLRTAAESFEKLERWEKKT